MRTMDGLARQGGWRREIGPPGTLSYVASLINDHTSLARDARYMPTSFTVNATFYQHLVYEPYYGAFFRNKRHNNHNLFYSARCKFRILAKHNLMLLLNLCICIKCSYLSIYIKEYRTALSTRHALIGSS